MLPASHPITLCLNIHAKLRIANYFLHAVSLRLPPCRCRFDFYNGPVLDIKLIREKPDFVRQRLATRGAGDEARIDELLMLDEQRRKIVAEVESLKAQRNRESKAMGARVP